MSGFSSSDFSVDCLNRRANRISLVLPNGIETIGIGVTDGEINGLVQRHLGDPFFGVRLNPGHLIHLDEWMNSPIYHDSQLTRL